MKRAVQVVVIFGILGVLAWAALGPAASYWRNRNRVKFREEEATTGTIIASVNATGTIKPVRSVKVGSFVSGPILELPVDYNTEVKSGQLLATIDPRIYKANVARDRAALVTRQAEVKQIAAKLQLAKNDEKRSLALRKQNEFFISDSEMDQFKFNRMGLEAQLAVAEAAVLQAKGNLELSEANLEYTQITSPVDGVIIDRKIDPGQTVAASFQTPELFVVAPDLRKEVHVYASVDEADIGLITQAQREARSVHFTVDAYPDDLFPGKIFQIRKNATTTQNVVTYPVVVSAPNADLKLFPDMTATVSFRVNEKSSVLRIPNAALRFFPKTEQVHPDDRKLLEGTFGAEIDEQEVAMRSAEERAESRRQRNRRHVWVLEKQFLRAVEVETGISNSQYTEMVAGDLTPGQKLVTGIDLRKR